MQVHTAVMRPIAAILLAVVLAVALVVFEPATTPAGAFPGQAQVDAAREAVRSQASTVAELDAAIVQLEKAHEQAERAASIALEQHARAQDESIAAQRVLFAANERARQADASLQQARAILAEAAIASQRDRESFGDLEAVLSSEGFDDVIARVELIQRASDNAERGVQEVHAAELVAGVMREHAETAAVAAAEAEERARVALENAQVALEEAAQALMEVEQLRDEAVKRLAELRRTSQQVERERQKGLEAERREREWRAWEAANNAASNGGGAASGSGGNEGSSGDNGSPPPSSGTWSSSAAQGQAAAAHARTLIGTPYSQMTCSQLTGAAWSTQGFNVGGWSGAQYPATTQVPFSQKRPGDLLFWGTGQNPNNMYHVAIYVGNGRIVEARSGGPGTAHERNIGTWAINDLLPTVGRP